MKPDIEHWPAMPTTQGHSKMWTLDPCVDTLDVGDVMSTVRRLVKVGHLSEGYYRTTKGLCGTCGCDTMLVFGHCENCAKNADLQKDEQ